jgi:energy-converting hydrogenase B subunit D
VSLLHAVVLVLVAAAGTAVVLTRRPTGQVLVNSMYGLLVALLFLVFQAPDVALSQVVVSGLILPLLILLALAKVRGADPRDGGPAGEEPAGGDPR